MKVKTPPAYILWLVTFFVIALVIIIPYLLDMTGVTDIEEIFFWVLGTLIGWTFLIALALIGAIFVGMLLSHRILTVGAFTPFEEEMLKMREDIKAINEKLDSLAGIEKPLVENSSDKKEEN